MNERTRIVATDIGSDPHFSNHLRSLLLRAKVCSLQSTPLIDPSGRLVGVVSTHYSHPGTPSPEALKHIDDLASSFLVKINA
jgi:GAF domain-containing protein